jgi:hypothetical protein
MKPPQVTRVALIRRLKAASLFKLILIVNALFFSPFCLLCSVAALLGAHSVEVGGKSVTGIAGLAAGLVMIPIFVVLFSLICWFFFYVAIRIVGHFKLLKLEYVTDENQ